MGLLSLPANTPARTSAALRSLFALGFQGFLIMICVGIYAVLVQNISYTDDIIGSVWVVLGYTILLCFTLFKTGSLAKSVFAAH